MICVRRMRCNEQMRIIEQKPLNVPQLQLNRELISAIWDATVDGVDLKTIKFEVNIFNENCKAHKHTKD